MPVINQILKYIKEKAESASDCGYSYTAHLLYDLHDELEIKFSRGEAGSAPPVAIGDEVYAVLCPFDENDPPAYIEPYLVYGVGVAKDGKTFIINEDLERFMLDDEDEGLSFSTREKAEQYLKGLEKNGM